MAEILLTPPIAFVLYLALSWFLVQVGRLLAGPTRAALFKTSVYSSGEAPPQRGAAPGYQPFFVTALFFAVLHLGVLMLATINIGQLAPLSVAYLVGLALTLVVLILR
jgi:NADH:ubiquinone oxidoreductase subunit 3 (subunit A)